MSAALEANFVQEGAYPENRNVYNVEQVMAGLKKHPETMQVEQTYVVMGKALVPGEAVTAQYPNVFPYVENEDGSFDTIYGTAVYYRTKDNGDGTLTRTGYNGDEICYGPVTAPFNQLDYPEVTFNGPYEIDDLLSTADIRPLGFQYRPGVLSVLVQDPTFVYALAMVSMAYPTIVAAELDSGAWVMPVLGQAPPPYDNVDYDLCHDDGMYRWVEYQVSLEPGTHSIRFCYHRPAPDDKMVREPTQSFTFTIQET